MALNFEIFDFKDVKRIFYRKNFVETSANMKLFFKIFWRFYIFGRVPIIGLWYWRNE